MEQHLELLETPKQTGTGDTENRLSYTEPSLCRYLISRAGGASNDQLILVIRCLTAKEWCFQAGCVHSVQESIKIGISWHCSAKRDRVIFL